MSSEFEPQLAIMSWIGGVDRRADVGHGRRGRQVARPERSDPVRTQEIDIVGDVLAHAGRGDGARVAQCLVILVQAGSGSRNQSWHDSFEKIAILS